MQPLFYLAVLLALGLFGYIGLMLLTGMLGLNPDIAAMGHFGSESHRIHDVTYALLLGTGAAGLAAQLRTPSKQVAAQWMALVPWVAFLVAFASGGILQDLLIPPFIPMFGGLTLVAMVLHPAGAGLFDWLRPARVSTLLLALAVIATGPLLAFALGKIEVQRTVPDEHAAMSHYAYMAAFAMTVTAVALLTALRPPGWRLTAWVAALLAAAFGAISLALPGVESGLPPVWALLAIGWGLVFLAAAESTARRGARATAGDETGCVREGRIPGGGMVLAIVVLVGVLLVAALHLAGSSPGPGGHAGPASHGPP